MAFLQHKLPCFPTAPTRPPPLAPWTLVSPAPSHVAPEYPGPQACSSPPHPTTTQPLSLLQPPSSFFAGSFLQEAPACGQPRGPAAQPSHPRVHRPCLFSLQLPSPRGLALVFPILPQPHQPESAIPGTITPTRQSHTQPNTLPEAKLQRHALPPLNNLQWLPIGPQESTRCSAWLLGHAQWSPNPHPPARLCCPCFTPVLQPNRFCYFLSTLHTFQPLGSGLL